jgi:hypothetical protein
MSGNNKRDVTMVDEYLEGSRFSVWRERECIRELRAVAAAD